MSNEISEKPKITFEDEMAFAGYVHEGDKDKVMEYLRKCVGHKSDYKHDFSMKLLLIFNAIYCESMIDQSTRAKEDVLKECIMLVDEAICEEVMNMSEKMQNLSSIGGYILKYHNASISIRNDLIRAVEAGSLRCAAELLQKYPDLLEMSEELVDNLMKKNEKKNNVNFSYDHFSDINKRKEAEKEFSESIKKGIWTTASVVLQTRIAQDSSFASRVDETPSIMDQVKFVQHIKDGLLNDCVQSLKKYPNLVEICMKDIEKLMKENEQTNLNFMAENCEEDHFSSELKPASITNVADTSLQK